MFCLPLTGMKTEDFKIELTQWFRTTKQLIPHEIFSFLTLSSLTRHVNEKNMKIINLKTSLTQSYLTLLFARTSFSNSRR